MTTNRIHVALNTNRFDASVDFYRRFFGKDPVKLKPGYAKFSIDQPALNFTLNESGSPPQQQLGSLNHLGIEVASTEEVRNAARRLSEAGFLTSEENDTDCCYALQDKVWVTDPNGYSWEVFVVKVGDTSAEQPQEPKAAPCCAPTCCA